MITLLHYRAKCMPPFYPLFPMSIYRYKVLNGVHVRATNENIQTLNQAYRVKQQTEIHMGVPQLRIVPTIPEPKQIR